MLGDWVSACAPGEFEQQAAMMLGLNELLSHAPQIAVGFARALIEVLPLIAIVNSEEQRREAVTLLCDWGVPAHLMQFVSMPARGMWVRDFGPSFVRWSDGSVAIVDPDYVAADRPNDDLMPSQMAGLLNVPVVKAPLTSEGGNILSNGQGICVTSWAMVVRNAHRGYGEAQVTSVLSEYYGFYTGIYLAALQGEPTGHVDMFATLVSPDVLVLGSYDPAMDAENAKVLDRNAEALRGLRTCNGPLNVVRIPMPSNKDGVWRTYTNVVFANGRLLVPSYPSEDQDLEKRAMAVYAQVLPGWEIVPIDCEGLIRQRGALRCVTLNIPWLTDRFVCNEAPKAPSVTAAST